MTFLSLLFNFLKNLSLIGGLLLYNIGLASALQYSLQQCESAVMIHMPLPLEPPLRLPPLQVVREQRLRPRVV